MRIGIDLDDTIFDTKKRYLEYQTPYLMKKCIDAETLWHTKKYRFDFLKSNIHAIFDNLEVKKDAVKVIEKLKKAGNEIVILTARSKKYDVDVLKITENSLKKNHIYYDKIILTEKYKLNECLKNNIDIMIDNSMYIYDELKSGGINVLLFDENNEHKDIVERVSSWKEIEKLLIGK